MPNSSEDVESIESESLKSEQDKFKLSGDFNIKEKLKDFPEILDYIYYLEKQLRRQKKKLKKYRNKLVKNEVHDVQTQTEEVAIDNVVNNCQEATEPKSIAQEIKEAAELATQSTGFVYDEVSGLYYDSNTGYYYNSEYGLYYDANTGTYMSYNQETKSYEFHSQVYPNHNNQKQGNKGPKNEKKRKSRKKHESQVNTSSDLEHLSKCFTYLKIDNKNKIRSYATEISKQWPPCMRIIVEQSKQPKIKIGSLHILTYKGGTLGREGDHAVLLPDINISKCHLKFSFNEESNKYFVIDMGSRNGTVLNGKRMSSSKQESELFEVAHGSRIQIGSVVLLCHIHEGSKTCGLCEPGLIQLPEKKVDETINVTKSDKHKMELKKLRKKFGVSHFEEPNVKLASGYTDRAQHRRDTVGSQNPHEKTEVASVDESISSQNKGFKMLSKMGWKEGQSLGKDNQGLVEPINVVANPGTSGMGNTSEIVVEAQVDKQKQKMWKKTQERFKQLPTSNDMFDESD